MTTSISAAASGTFSIGGELPVHRLGYGAMQLTGEGVWGPPKDPDEARRVLRRAVELGVTFIDTALASSGGIEKFLSSVAESVAWGRGSERSEETLLKEPE